MKDTNPQHPSTTSKPKPAPSSKSTRTPHRNLVRDVTAENYQEIGSSFISMHGGAIIALADGQSQGVEWTANPRQWGAWRAYLSKRKTSIKFMDARGKEGKCWTVPAAWPHDFDGDATLQEDQQAADWFMRNYRPERIELASAAQRAITAAAYRKWAKEARPKEELPDVPQKPELKYNDYDELLANYAKDMAALRERTKRT